MSYLTPAEVAELRKVRRALIPGPTVIDKEREKWCYVYYPEPVEPIIIPERFGGIGNTGHDRSVFRTTVSGFEYDLCEKVNPLHWNALKRSGPNTSHYVLGLDNIPSDPYRVERRGEIGETALAKIFKTFVDNRFYPNGDRGDTRLLGEFTVDVKTSRARPGLDRENGQVYAKNGNGVWIKKYFDILVIGYLSSEEDREKREAVVDLVGWIRWEALKNCPLVLGTAPGSTHWNWEIPYKDLRHMQELYDAHMKWRYLTNQDKMGLYCPL